MSNFFTRFIDIVMPSSTGSSGSPTGSAVGSKCVFKKICGWEDANVSAAVLTAGNLMVLFLLNENPVAWLQFAIVFGLLPLGLAARVFGFDSTLRGKMSSLGIFAGHGKTREETKSADFIRIAIGLIVAARMISAFGLPLTIGIIGNLAMLVPLVWSYIDMKQVKTTLENFKNEVGKVVELVAEKAHQVDAMLVPILVGLAFFMLIIGFGKIVDTLFVALLGFAGYGILLAVAVAPESLTSGHLGSRLEAASWTKMYEKEFNKVVTVVNSVVFWESFTRSVAAFLGLYGVYVVSSFTGLAFVVACLGGLTMTFSLSPEIVREKLEARLNALVSSVEAKVASMLTKQPKEEIKATENDETLVLVNAQDE